MTPESERILAKLDAEVTDAAGVIRFYRDALERAETELASAAIRQEALTKSLVREKRWFWAALAIGALSSSVLLWRSL